MFDDLKISIEYWPLADLIPYAKNPRKNDHAVDKAAKIISRIGFRLPILVKSDGLIIDGHLRLKVAEKLGMQTVPVSICDDMSETEIKALRLSVNRMADLADWDFELLGSELDDLAMEGIDKQDLGFDEMNWDMGNPDTALDDIDENLDGIMATLKIKCPQETVSELTAFIKETLKNSKYKGLKVG